MLISQKRYESFLHIAVLQVLPYLCGHTRGGLPSALF